MITHPYFQKQSTYTLFPRYSYGKLSTWSSFIPTIKFKKIPIQFNRFKFSFNIMVNKFNKGAKRNFLYLQR